MADPLPKPDEAKVIETRYVEAPPAQGTGSLWFILGGVVVAIGIVLFIVYGNFGGSNAPTGTNVTIENGQNVPVGSRVLTPSANPPATAAAPPVANDAATPAPAPAPAGN